MVALVVCAAALALPLAYRLGYRRCLRRIDCQAWELTEGFRKLQVARKAASAQREIIALGTRRFEEKWQRRHPYGAPRSVPKSGTPYDPLAARAARDRLRARGGLR